MVGRDTEAQREVAYEKRLRRVGLSVARIGLWCAGAGQDGVRVVEVRFKTDADDDTGVLLILKAVRGTEKLVGFMGGLALEDVVIAAAKKLQAGAVRWREDRPWGE